jgi:hypothetical protein
MASHDDHAAVKIEWQGGTSGLLARRVDIACNMAMQLTAQLLLLLLLLHGPGRGQDHPVKEPNVAHGVGCNRMLLLCLRQVFLLYLRQAFLLYQTAESAASFQGV